MRLHRAQRRYGCEISIAPLIDVVFLLIIFFMTISQISRVEVEELMLPEAKAGEVSEEKPPGRLVVNVHKDGRIVVGGEPESIDSLRELLAREVKERGANKLTVVVRGDRDTRWEHVAEIMRVCGACGIGGVKIAVVESEGEGPGL